MQWQVEGPGQVILHGYRARLNWQVEELFSYLPKRRPEDAGSGASEMTPPNATIAASSFGSLNIDDFTLLKPISRGSFGRVYLCQKNATKDLYAIKVRTTRGYLQPARMSNDGGKAYVGPFLRFLSCVSTHRRRLEQL